ncbi:preprotein translocase subunit SecG [Xanthobacter sediminis]
MQTVLIVIHLLVVLSLIGVVLIQRSEGGGLGIGGGGGGGGGFFTARGTANVLTRATAILALLFFITSLSLTIVAGWGRAPRSILAPAGQSQSAPGAPQSGGSILDQIRPQGAGAPQPGAVPAPAAPAPSGPQVPQSQ